MNILHYIALIAAAANVVRKVLMKRTAVDSLYAKAWGGMSGRMMRKYKIKTDDYVVGVIAADGHKYFTWWNVSIPCKTPDGVFQYGQRLEDWGNENLVCGRLGPGVHVELFSRVPNYATTVIKRSRKGGYETTRILDEYSIPRFAKTHGLTVSQAYDILRDFAVGVYRKMMLDGLYPPEVFL